MSLLDRVASSPKLRGQMRDAIRRSKQEGVEMGFPLCHNSEGLVAGEREMTKGNENSTQVVLACPVTKGDMVGSFHSVKGDNPVFVEQANLVDIRPIERVCRWGHSIDKKNVKGVRVYSLEGFTELIHAIKHPAPSFLRVNTPDGLLEVTPNHSLFDDKRNPVVASEISIGQKILSSASAPDPSERTSLDPELAWLYGLFAAEGYVSNRGVVAIDMLDENALREAARIVKRHFAVDCNLWISRPADYVSPMYRLQLRESRPVSEYFNWLFYWNLHHGRDKRVPRIVLNAPRYAMSEFLNGYWTGDGARNPSGRAASKSVSKALAAGIFYLCARAFGLEKLNILFDNKKNATSVTVALGHRRGNAGLVKSLEPVDMHTTGPFLAYDLETKDHAFMAGIGQIIAHNSHVKGPRYPSRRDIANLVTSGERVICTGQEDKVVCLEPKPSTGPQEVLETVEEINKFSTPFSLAPEFRYREAVEKHFTLKEFGV